MKNAILRWVYNRFAAKFEVFLVEDFMQKIPKEVSEEAFSVVSDSKKKLTRLNRYIAFNLHKKMAADPTNSQKYMGMFINLKVMDSMILGRPETIRDKKDPLKTEKPNKFQEHLNAATSFATEAIKKRKG